MNAVSFSGRFNYKQKEDYSKAHHALLYSMPDGTWEKAHCVYKPQGEKYISFDDNDILDKNFARKQYNQGINLENVDYEPYDPNSLYKKGPASQLLDISV